MRLSGSAALLALLATTLSPAAPAHATAETCHNLSATMVGSPGEPLFGTDGPDVIVTNGAREVDARDGDDVVCTTRSGPIDPDSPTAVFVEAGAGDDIVDTGGDVALATYTDLGPGTDSFFGGTATIADSVHSPEDGAPDLVAPGHGDDTVSLEDSLTGEQVTLGTGDDALLLLGPISSQTTISGGDGVDGLQAHDSRTGGWVYDNRLDVGAGEARREGVRQFGWTGMERFDLANGATHATTRFLGGSADETVHLRNSIAGARMGAGDDAVVVVNPSPAVPGTRLLGGPGRDALTVTSAEAAPLRDARVDLRGHTLEVLWHQRGITLGMSGFERHWAAARSVSVVGDARDNIMIWSGCRVWIRGGGGDDRVRWERSTDVEECASSGRGSTIRGNHGDDVLIGSPYADTLDGGAGHDVARAGQGRDRCAAEVRRSCELRMAP